MNDAISQQGEGGVQMRLDASAPAGSRDAALCAAWLHLVAVAPRVLPDAPPDRRSDGGDSS